MTQIDEGRAEPPHLAEFGEELQKATERAKRGDLPQNELEDIQFRYHQLVNVLETMMCGLEEAFDSGKGVK